MAKTLQAVRGMNDILPGESSAWQSLEACLRDVVQSYGYQEIRLPLLEKTELFKRSIGEVTDIQRYFCQPGGESCPYDYSND